jgi:hypothetical protein
MHSIREDAIGGFNEFVEKQKDAPGKTRITLIQFNHKYQPVYTRKKIKDVEPLTFETYVPDGWTALLDAIGKSISDGLKNKAHKADRTIYVILTDGHENSSTEYTRDAVRALIENCQEEHKWTFLFLGADMGAYDEAMSIGIKRDFVAAYAPTSEGTAKAYKAVGSMAFTATTMGDEDDWETTLDDEYAKS